MNRSGAVESAAVAATSRQALNDFTIKVATVNGTGSQTANNTLIRAIMRMGVPVSGKNIFPSNIQGLPTWYVIRVCEQGWVAPPLKADVVIAMNRVTAREDVMKCAAGGIVLYDAPFDLAGLRDDVTFFSVPFGTLVKQCCPNPKLWKLVTNMIYVGAAAVLMDIDLAEVDAGRARAFSNKPKALEINRAAVEAGAAYAREHFDAAPRFRIERRDLTEGKILIDGNSAAALGAVMGGLSVLTWYPITPSSSVAETTEEYLNRFRTTEDGKKTFAVLQAEDELAAIGMVIGAGWGGARAMTTTSGPGISLMSEFIGLSYYAEIPALIANVQRVGPSTGLPTRTMQGDVSFCAYNSHGDTKHPLLLPASVQESYELMIDGLNLAEQFQTVVFFVTDLDLGMNNWLSDPFPYPETPIERGKVLDAEALKAMGVENWGRYRDVDGDGIPYRTLPGTEIDGGAYFTRGSGHNEWARYTESEEVYRENVDRLSRKFDTMRSHVPAPVEDAAPEATPVGLIAYGTTHWAVIEARERLREAGIEFDYLRLRAFPFPDSVRAFFDAHERVYVVEQNRDGQMASMIRNEIPEVTAKIRSVVHYDGMPIHAGAVIDGITSGERS